MSAPEWRRNRTSAKALRSPAASPAHAFVGGAGACHVARREAARLEPCAPEDGALCQLCVDALVPPELKLRRKNRPGR